MSLRMCDVRFRGRGFTLYVAAQEAGLNEYLMSDVLYAIYLDVGLIDKSNGYYIWDWAPDELRQRDMPMVFSIDCISSERLQEAIEAGLLTKRDESSVELTEKSISILERAAVIQKELEAENFYCKPCGFCDF